MSPNTTTADATVYIEVSMHDAGGFLMQFSDDAMAALAVDASTAVSTGTRSLAVTASGGARRLSDAVASLQQMVAGANNNSFMLSFRPRIVTDIVLTV